jgi:hypothetical protein
MLAGIDIKIVVKSNKMTPPSDHREFDKWPSTLRMPLTEFVSSIVQVKNEWCSDKTRNFVVWSFLGYYESANSDRVW